MRWWVRNDAHGRQVLRGVQVKPFYLPPTGDMDIEDQPEPGDDLPPCAWQGHCDCYHQDGEPCCDCGEVPGDYYEE